MKIHITMSLHDLRDHMGEAATLEDAEEMRRLMVRRNLSSLDTADVADAVWDRCLCEAYAIAANKAKA